LSIDYPAAVCMLDTWIDDKRLQSIAAENNLSETAFRPS
jgi:predicted PhzF superfamily epimerase YddE/YHI9